MNPKTLYKYRGNTHHCECIVFFFCSVEVCCGSLLLSKSAVYIVYYHHGQTKFIGNFSLGGGGGILHLKYNIWSLSSKGPILTNYTRKHVKYNTDNLKTNHFQSIQEQDQIYKRSNPASQPTNFTTNNKNCAVGGLLFGSLDF